MIAIRKNCPWGVHLDCLSIQIDGRRIKKAEKARKTFTKIYMPEAVESGLVRTEDLKWTAVKVKKDMIIIIFNAPSDAYAKEKLEKVEARIKN